MFSSRSLRSHALLQRSSSVTPFTARARQRLVPGVEVAASVTSVRLVEIRELASKNHPTLAGQDNRHLTLVG